MYIYIFFLDLTNIEHNIYPNFQKRKKRIMCDSQKQNISRQYHISHWFRMQIFRSCHIFLICL